MSAVVLASNILVQYPVAYGALADYLTWGAFSYPFAFLITDLSNRRFGVRGARRVVYVGFVLAVLLSAYFATPRIAIASGSVPRRATRHQHLRPPARPSLVAAALRVVRDLVGARHRDVLLSRLLLRHGSASARPSAMPSAPSVSPMLARPCLGSLSRSRIMG